MNYSVKINGVKTVDELEGAWINDDFIDLLKRFNYEDVDKVSPKQLRDYLFLSITDFEPNETPAILLDYRLWIDFPNVKLAICPMRWRGKKSQRIILISLFTVSYLMLTNYYSMHTM